MKNYLKEMLVTLADAGVEFVVGGGAHVHPAFVPRLGAPMVNLEIWREVAADADGDRK
jgi:hypothetical protein